MQQMTDAILELDANKDAAELQYLAEKEQLVKECQMHELAAEVANDEFVNAMNSGRQVARDVKAAMDS